MGIFKSNNETKLSHEDTTKLATALHFIGAGQPALEDLQARVDQLTGEDNRIVVGEITFDSSGRPVCDLEFNCSSYDPPVDGYPDPKAIEDLREILQGINFDGCLGWGAINLLTEEPVGVC